MGQERHLHPVYDILKDEGSCCIKFWKREKVKGQKKQGPDEAGGQLASWKPVGGCHDCRHVGRERAVGEKPLELEPLAAKTRPAPVLLSLAGSSKAFIV